MASSSRSSLADLLSERQAGTILGGEEATLRELVAEPRLHVVRVGIDAPTIWRDQIARLERVHAIGTPTELDRRLAPDRRVFALVSDADPDVALGVLHVALIDGLADSMPALLDGPVRVLDDPSAALYSINTHPALAGWALAPMLLKLALIELEADGVDGFATLSPVPGLRHWLGDAAPELAAELDDAVATGEVASRLAHRAVPYLTEPVDGRLRDPVGNFHVGNGAAVARVCPAADPSPAGIGRAWGLMVNYRYEPECMAARAAAYRSTGQVTVEPAVSSLSSLSD